MQYLKSSPAEYREIPNNMCEAIRQHCIRMRFERAQECAQ